MSGFAHVILDTMQRPGITVSAEVDGCDMIIVRRIRFATPEAAAEHAKYFEDAIKQFAEASKKPTTEGSK